MIVQIVFPISLDPLSRVKVLESPLNNAFRSNGVGNVVGGISKIVRNENGRGLGSSILDIKLESNLFEPVKIKKILHDIGVWQEGIKLIVQQNGQENIIELD